MNNTVLFSCGLDFAAGTLSNLVAESSIGRGALVLADGCTAGEFVSPVIALMLILAILATCLAVYTTTYVPGLKQQDEITHSGEVKLAFMRLAADIDPIIEQEKPAVYTEVLELGGGDVPLSPTKSSGTIEINTSKIGMYQIESGTPQELNGIEVIYTPSFTAWENQGYTYKNGVVWITKENSCCTEMLHDSERNRF